MTPTLTARGLRVHLPDGSAVVDGVDLTLGPGRVLALVGPSGAGKSLTVAALARLLPTGLSASGDVRLGGEDLLAAGGRRLRTLRGTRLAWVGQDATASLNPTVSVGRHLTETLRAHPARPGPVPGRGRARDRPSAQQVRARGVAALVSVGLPDAGALWDAHPSELSGGQAQRVAIALATLLDPTVLLADEITSALDVVSQAEVMGLLRAQADAGRAVLVITHDLRAAARWADDVVALDAGHVVEHGAVADVLPDGRR